MRLHISTGTYEPADIVFVTAGASSQSNFDQQIRIVQSVVSQLDDTIGQDKIQSVYICIYIYIFSMYVIYFLGKVA